jgi:mannose-6-phosphate isomerase-like protein (cupin superfamily)
MEKIFELEKLMSKLEDEGNYFLTFVNLHSIQAGILRLRPSEEDVQEPHSSDEIYFVIRGNGFIQVNNRKHKLIPNSFIYIPANVEHRFYGNTEELLVAYFLTN